MEQVWTSGQGKDRNFDNFAYLIIWWLVLFTRYLDEEIKRVKIAGKTCSYCRYGKLYMTVTYL